MKVHAGVDGNLRTFLISALGGGEWLHSCSDHLIISKELWETSGWESAWSPYPILGH